MENIKKRGFFPLVCVCAFVACVTISALLGSMIVTGNVYTVALPERSGSVLDAPALIAKFTASSAVQLSLIFISGYTAFAKWISVGTTAYRGVCLGYTASVIADGSLFIPKESLSVFHIANVKLGLMTVVIYGASCILSVLGACLSSENADRFLGEGRSIVHSMRYISRFTVISGGVFLCDILRLLLFLL